MFLQTLLTVLYGFLTILVILLVLVQRGKNSMGLGGGGNQMLFGASGGQDFLQKLTWVIGALIMAGSLTLGMLISQQGNRSSNAPLSMPVDQHFD